MSVQRALVVVMCGIVATVLTGCSLVTPRGAEEKLSGVAKCAQGTTWILDNEKLVETVKSDLKGQGVAATDVSVTGSQNMEWLLDGSVTMTSDYTVTITTNPAADQTLTVTTTHKGTATGASYISSGVAIPRDWDATAVEITTTGDLNGAATEDVPFTVINPDLDDSVGIELSCDGNRLTTHQRGGSFTETWARKG